jgi:hypothetical protein
MRKIAPSRKQGDESEMGDLYALLGVNRTATSNEIKSAYRRLARKYHPDINSDPTAQSKFTQINEAYHTLIDPDRRRTYDRTGAVSSATYARQTANSGAARRAYYQARADRIVNEWLRREREETRARGKAVYTTVTLFVSTFIVAIGFIPLPSSMFSLVIVVMLFAIGVGRLYTSFKEHFDYYTYRPSRISVTRPIRRPDKRFKRSSAWAFVIIGYLISVGAGILIGLLIESFSTHPADAFLVALIYPPIAVLILDMMYLINSR